MTPTLRPYQTTAVDAVRRAYAEGARAVCLTAPTGSGKTVTFGYIARRAATKGTKVLILVHRRELLLQASRALSSMAVPHGLIMAGLPISHAQVRVASVQTLVRRLQHTTPPDLLVIDEAHHAIAGSWGKVLQAWPNARVLGVTATPARLDGRGLDSVFQRLILGPSVRSLIEEGYLAPVEVYAPPVVADLSGVRTMMGDFDRSELKVRMDRSTVTGDCVEHYTRLTPGRPAIAFCASIDHAYHVSEAFRAAGVPSESVDGEMPNAERDGVLRRLATGEVRVLTSCDLVSEGLNLPEVEVAILLRPTQSLTVYLQQVGRIMRPAEGKSCATVLDHAGNTERHGLPDQPRTWTLEGRRRSKKPGLPPMCRCPECYACFSPAPVCPMCGCVLPVKARGAIAHVEGQLERVTDSYAEARERMRRQHKEQGECGTLEELVALGVRRGYASPEGWARRVYAGRQRQRVYA